MLDIKLILGSKSPRRQALIQELGYPVEIRVTEVEEIYPDSIASEEVPEYLARLKAVPLINGLTKNEVLITSDTIVLLEDEVIGKPTSAENARKMLHKLSGKTHNVITGVCMTSTDKAYSFSSVTKVFFSELTSAEIDYYVDKFSPMDKAGSYAIQEWIGYIGVAKIEGCYYNVMGLPLHDLNKNLKLIFSN
jgi:septum formation protein